MFEANESVLLFSRFVDKYEINNLRKGLQDLLFTLSTSSLAVGNGVGIAVYNIWEPEINAFADLLYYSINFLSGQPQTLGQSLCNLSMFKHFYSVDHSPKFLTLSNLDRMKISLSYVLLSYLIQRKEFIFNTFRDVVAILCYTDDEVINDTDTVIEKPISMFYNIWIALKKSAFKIGVDTSSRLNNILTIFEDIHTFFFLRYGRYL